MQIVIDIPKEEYEYLKAHHSHEVFYGDAIANGTPLPEHHGRLIDADTLDECKEMMNTIMGECKYAVRMDDIRNAPTIIEATGAKE